MTSHCASTFNSLNMGRKECSISETPPPEAVEEIIVIRMQESAAWWALARAVSLSTSEESKTFLRASLNGTCPETGGTGVSTAIVSCDMA